MRQTTLALYRQLRAGHLPEGALELLRVHVRAARAYAEAYRYDSMAFLLADEESCVTQWLQDARLRADRDDLHGRYWRFGELQGALTFEVARFFPDGRQTSSAFCESAGCAIKHAFAWLRSYPAGLVLISANRRFTALTIDAHTSMRQLLAVSWPVD